MGKSPSGTRESWSWKMRSTCLAVGTTSPLKRNKFRVKKKKHFLFRFFTKSNYLPGNMRMKSLQKKQQIQCAPGPCYVLYRPINELSFVLNVLCSVLPRPEKKTKMWSWLVSGVQDSLFCISMVENIKETFFVRSPAWLVSQSPQDWSPAAASSSS